AGTGRGPRVELPIAGVRAEAELMAAPHEGDVVGDPVEVVLRPPLPTPNQGERATDVDRELAGNVGALLRGIRVHFHAHVGRAGKPRIVVPVRIRPAPREPEPVDE